MIWMLTIPSRPDRWSSTIPDQQTPRPCWGCRCCCCFVLWIFVCYFILLLNTKLRMLMPHDECCSGLLEGDIVTNEGGIPSWVVIAMLLQGWSPWTANSVGFFCLCLPSYSYPLFLFQIFLLLIWGILGGRTMLLLLPCWFIVYCHYAMLGMCSF